MGPVDTSLVSTVRPAGPPHSLQSLQTVSWENWQKPAKIKNSHPSQPAQISIGRAWVREEGEVSCPFLFKFRLAGKTLVIDPLSQGQLLLLVYLILWPEYFAWQPSGWVVPKYSWTEMWVSLHFKLGSYQLLQLSEKLSKSFLLSCAYLWECLWILSR